MLAQKKVKTERVLPTLEQLAELLGIVIAIVVNIFKRMDRSSVQYWIGHEKGLASVLKNALLSKDPQSVDEKVVDWVKFYHDVFRLELDPAEMVLGCKKKIEIPVVGTREVEIKPGSQHGKTLRFKGEGTHRLPAGAKGDLIVTLRVKIPERPSSKEREWYEAIAKEKGLDAHSKGLFGGLF